MSRFVRTLVGLILLQGQSFSGMEIGKFEGECIFKLPGEVITSIFSFIPPREQALFLRFLLKDVEKGEKSGIVSTYADYKEVLESFLEDIDKKRNELGLLLWNLAANNQLGLIETYPELSSFKENNDDYKKRCTVLAQGLIAQGAKLNAFKGGLVHNRNCLRWILPKTTLGVAAWLSSTQYNSYLMELLIGTGADLNGGTPELCAIKKREEFQPIKLSCEEAKVNYLDFYWRLRSNHPGNAIELCLPYIFDGKAPLFYAAEQGCLEAINKLLAHGADPAKEDYDGKKAVDYAQFLLSIAGKCDERRKTAVKIIELLKQAEVKRNNAIE